MSIQTDRVRITALFNKKQGLTDEEFKRHWLEHHSKVFSSMEIAQKNLTKYEQVCVFRLYYRNAVLEMQRISVTQTPW